MMLVDSSVWIDYFTGVKSKKTDTLDVSLGEQTIAIGDLTLTEFLQGFRVDREFELTMSPLDELILFDMLGKEMAHRSAENFRFLRKKGVAIRKATVVVIASFCIEHELPFLFSDKDFRPFVRHLGLREA